MMMHAFIPGETEAGRSLHSRFQTSQGYVVRLCLQKGKRFRGKKVPTERSLIFKSQNFGVEKKLRTVFFFLIWIITRKQSGSSGCLCVGCCL